MSVLMQRSRPLVAARASFTRALSSEMRSTISVPVLPKNPLMRRLAAVDGLQKQYSVLEDEMMLKQRMLEEELKAASKAIFERRQLIVSGTNEPTEAEVAACDGNVFSGDEIEEAPMALEDTKGIPGFWKGVLHGADLNFSPSHVDYEVMEALEEIRVEKWEMTDEAFDDDDEVPTHIFLAFYNVMSPQN